MLTGLEEIVIGGGVTTTEVTFYDHRGLRIADTPGIRAGHCETHDAKAQDAIDVADLLVFVITNELFDDVLGTDFRRLCNEKGRAKELMIVINKSSSDPGDTKTKLASIATVLEPWEAEDFPIVFTAARSWFHSLDEDDEAERKELAVQSNRAGLVEGIDRFVVERGLYARITTPLQAMEAALQALLDELGPGTPLEKGLLLLMTQCKRLFQAGRRDFQKDARALLDDLHAKIVQHGNALADAVGGPQDKFDQLQEKTDSLCRKLVDQAVAGMLAAQERQQSELEEQLQELAKTPLGEKILQALQATTTSSAGVTGRPQAFAHETPWQFDAKTGKNLAKAAEKGLAFLAKSAVGDATKNGLKAVSGSSLHETVKTVGKFVGYKFEAWQAVRIADTIGKGAKFLGPVLAIASVGMQVLEDHRQSKLADSIRDAKRGVRKGFRDFAQQVATALERRLEEILRVSYDAPVAIIDEQLAAVRERNAQATGKAEAIRGLMKDIVDLRLQVGQKMTA